MILSSGAPDGSTTNAMPSSSRSNAPGEVYMQLPEPMHTSRSISISRATVGAYDAPTRIEAEHDRLREGQLLHRPIDPGRSLPVLRLGAGAGSGVAGTA